MFRSLIKAQRYIAGKFEQFHTLVARFCRKFDVRYYALSLKNFHTTEVCKTLELFQLISMKFAEYGNIISKENAVQEKGFGKQNVAKYIARNG